ncbi:MAG: GIY-YIG nuclease family protein [Prevotellaceae bacterium]|jgi:hypothetical protein|nr:GIY-YIG nuclease family protein [Prevotellaceae bacterium]
MKKDKPKEYIYIGQYLPESKTNTCKIGKTNNLERRLKEYNQTTGLSKTTFFQYLFTCEVKDMTQVESDIKKTFNGFREKRSREIYFYSSEFFKQYVEFIKFHKLFLEEIPVKTDESKQVIKIIKKTTPSLKERGLTRKDLLQKAQKIKNDEFYTRYEDVEKEIAMYDKNIWKDKVIFCNCDDAVDENDDRNTSAFALYFMRNFKELDLKKLICLHYGGGIDLFNQGAKGYAFIYIVTKDGFKGEKIYPKNFTGSFDDPLSLKILNEEADIVCTNPPFSRAADYWKILIESGKKFLIISNFTNVITNSFIPYFYENKVWAGYNRVDWYLNPKKQLVDASGHWYTNLHVTNRVKYKNLKIMPLKEIPEKHKKYDDSKTLLVDNNYIPKGYKKPFAVSAFPILSGVLEKGYKLIENKEYYPYINGKKRFARVLVQDIN